MNPRAHVARKRFGQNFLKDIHTIRRIVDSVAIGADDHVIEIGPGQGALTEPMLSRGAEVTAVEIDRDLYQALTTRFQTTNRLRLQLGDILDLDWRTLILDGKRNKLVANLPYNISTPVFFKLVPYRHLFYSIVIMLQKEMALRLCHTGEPGRSLKEYGILSVIAGCCFTVETICQVPAGCFVPRPQVDSQVLRLWPKVDDPLLQDPFFQFVRRLFNNRRKLLLSTFMRNEPELFARLTTDSRRRLEGLRPENLRPEEYLQLYRECKG